MNAGTISGATYAVDFAGSGTNRLIVDPGAVFGGLVAANSTAANTLELASGTGSIGGLGGVGSAFTNFQTLAVDAGGAWTLTGANTTTSVLDAGVLDLAGTLNNSATIGFQGGSSQLLIDNAANFGSNVGTPAYTGPQLQDFFAGEEIDLKNISSAGVALSYSATTGLLQITNGASQVATLDFQNSSLGSGGTFQAVSDGGIGTLITLSGSSPPPPPSAPSITAPATGSIITTTADPTISGSGISGDTVTVSIDGTVAGSTTVASGSWSFTPTTPLTNASHSVTATQAATGGPSSAPSNTDTFTINVPASPPPPPGAPSITAPATGSTITTTADPTISGSGISGDTVTVSIDGTVAGSTTVASGSWSFTPTTPLTNASHSVTATQAATGGPSSAPSNTDTFTINVPASPPPPPGAPSITAPATGSTITTTADPTISGSGISGDTVTVSIDGTVAGSTTVASGSWSFTPTTPLTNASHSVTATQAATGGPSSAPSNTDTFTINVPASPPPPPGAPSITAPATGSIITTTADPTISGSGISGDTVTVSIDGTVAGSTTVASGSWSFTPTTPLTNASHSVTATQAATGGPSSAPSNTDTFTINVPASPPPPPGAPSITAPATGSIITTTADPTISGSGISGDTVTVSIDGTVAGSTTVASGSWSFTPTTPLTNASHSVTATQAATGGPSSAPSNTDTFTINVPASPPPPPPPVAGADVQWQNGLGGELAVWGMNGAQAVSSNVVTLGGSPAVPDASWSVAGLGDFNGSGTNDFLWRNQNGTLIDWTMNGSQITASQAVTFGGSPVAPDNSWNVAGIGDFNGDGKSDILWRNTNGSLIDWTMNGSQVTASQQVTLGGSAAAPDSSWSVAGIGDFNGDGKSDILWRDTNGSLIDWTMNGSQITSSQTMTLGGSAAMPNSSWSVAAIGDFNGDGKSDILWRNTNGSLIDWTMNGSQITSSQEVTFGGSPVSLNSSWQIAQIGDFNGNGTSDILLRNTSSGAMEEWSMNGAQIASASQVTFQGSPATPPNTWNTLAKPTDFV